ncbi:MAG: hypothetical protein J6K63_00030 [Clostridia bacterium]|nr:hypothetical protein [Clostridia bacterium]
MADYNSAKAVCPYYHKCDSNRVCCDGVEDGTSIHLVFGDSKRQKAYRERFCNSLERYQTCKLCEMFDRLHEDG